MAKATGNISQKAVAVKLNKEQIAVLDRIVELGEFNGRSHAIRELVMPALEAGCVAVNERSQAKALFKYGRSMKTFSDRLGKIAENSKQLPRDSRGQGIIDLGDLKEPLIASPA